MSNEFASRILEIRSSQLVDIDMIDDTVVLISLSIASERFSGKRKNPTDMF